MKKIKSTLFLALFVVITATSTLAQAPGQIPIVGRGVAEPNKTTAVTIVAVSEPKNDIPSEISKYLWTLVNIARQINF